MKKPKVKNTVKIDECVFTIYAYKKLTKSEVLLSIRQWMLHTRRKTIPKKGRFTIYSILGFDTV